MSRVLGKVLGGVVLIAVVVLSYMYFRGDQGDNGVLRASGTIEATNVDVSFEISGRVKELLVTEGKAIKAGDVLARLSPEERIQYVNQIQASLDAASSQIRQQQLILELRRDVLEQQIAQARGQADAMASVAQKQRVGSRPQEIRVAEAELKQAEAILVERKNDFTRISDLAKRDVLSQKELDAATSQLRAAETNRDAAAERLALAQEGARKEDVAEAEAHVKSAQAGVGIAEAGRKEVDIQAVALATARARERELYAQLKAAQTMLEHTEIRSPLTGVVLTKNVENGEFVSPGTPVVTIADIDNLWMNVYIPEAQMGFVKLDQPVDIRVDSFPNETFKGKVTFISAKSEFTPKTIQTPEERIKLVFRVKVSIENTNQRLKPGMPADAEVRLQ